MGAGPPEVYMYRGKDLQNYGFESETANSLSIDMAYGRRGAARSLTLSMGNIWAQMGTYGPPGKHARWCFLHVEIPRHS